MGIAKIGLKLLNEVTTAGGKTVRSSLLTTGMKKPVNLKGLKYLPTQEDTFIQPCRDELKKLMKCSEHEIGGIEKYFMSLDGRYNKKAFDIITQLPDKDGYLPRDFLSNIAKRTNLNKVDKSAIMELRDIHIAKVRNHELGINQINRFWVVCIENDGSFSKSTLKEIKELLEKYPLKHGNNDFFAAAALRKYKGAKSVNELSVVNKNELLTSMVSQGFSEKAYRDIPCLPKTEEEYKAMISKLIEDTSLKVEKLPPKQRTAAIASLENLTKADNKTIVRTIEKLYPEIGKVGDDTVNLLRKIMSDSRFAELPKEDKLTIQLAAILRKSSSVHGVDDVGQSAFNAFYLAEKLGLQHESKLKLYALVKNQNLIKSVDAGNTNLLNLEVAACELRHENNFKMFEILNDAQNVNTKTKAAVIEQIKKVLNKSILGKNSVYSITQTKLPKASQFIVNGDSVKKVKNDGVENIVVYFDKKTPVQYKDETGAIRVLDPKDVYTYCHANK